MPQEERVPTRRAVPVLLALVGLAVSSLRADGSTMRVFAAASLTEVFRSMGDAFVRQGGVAATFNFAASSTLVQQIQQGAAAAVFAAADEKTMAALVQSGHVAGEPIVFALNRLMIAVPSDNPKRVVSLADLARPGVQVALAAPAVPAGRYAREAFAKAKVALPAGASEELDVKAVLAKVTLGEVDAGIVYATDVKAAGERVLGLAIPDEHDVVARYPIAVLRDAKDPKAARTFVDFVLSPSGRTLLAGAGFGLP
jgi:molybdate transport system substrate-binding protein